MLTIEVIIVVFLVMIMQELIIGVAIGNRGGYFVLKSIEPKLFYNTVMKSSLSLIFISLILYFMNKITLNFITIENIIFSLIYIIFIWKSLKWISGKYSGIEPSKEFFESEKDKNMTYICIFFIIQFITIISFLIKTGTITTLQFLINFIITILVIFIIKLNIKKIKKKLNNEKKEEENKRK